MDEKALFTKFWTNEAKTTAKVFSRIPEGSDYRPDPKSRTAKEIAWQIYCEERMIIDALETGRVEWKPPAAPATMSEVVRAYEQQSASIIERWQALAPERWSGKLEFFGNERPASPMAWSFLFDIVHHRGQISTYLRPMARAATSPEGGSADEREVGHHGGCSLPTLRRHDLGDRGDLSALRCAAATDGRRAATRRQ
jgi:uncharacterized damage-inducible protein DinB